MKENYKSRIRSLFVLASLTCSSFIKAQIVTFQNHYPTYYNQSGKDVIPTPDGGYLIAGTTETSIAYDLDLKITKTDAYGNILGTRQYGGSRPDFPNSMMQTNDGNFFIIGYTQSYSTGDMNIYLLKVNQNGDTLFTKVYGGYGNDEGKEIVATADGNYVIISGTNSPVYSDNNMSLMKIDPMGNVLWTKYYGDLNYQSGRSVKLCADGGFILAGKTAIGPNDIASLFIVKTNNAGDTTWTKVISGGSGHSYESKSIVVNGDGSYTMAVDDSSLATDSDVRVMKLTSTGTVAISKVYGGTDKDICKTIRATSDGGYVVSSIARSFGWINPDAWVLKFDANLDTAWTRHYGGSGHEHCYSARQTSDGGYIAIGHARSFSTSWELYFLKLDGAGAVGISEFTKDSKLAIFPNPTNGVINVDLTEGTEFTTFSISNSLGQVVYSQDLVALRGNQLMTVDLKEEQPGIYFVTLESSTKRITKKLILN